MNEIKAEYLPVSEQMAMRGIRQMYNFQFEESRASFEEFKRINSNLPSGYFYLVVLDWFTQRMVEDDSQVWGEMSRKLEEVITVAEMRLEKYPEDALSMVYLGAARGMKARIALSKNDWMLGPRPLTEFARFKVRICDGSWRMNSARFAHSARFTTCCINWDTNPWLLDHRTETRTKRASRLLKKVSRDGPVHSSGASG